MQMQTSIPLRNSPRFLDLPGGRRIATSEYGDPAGEPVFFYHGWPSSRTMGAITDDAARELGLRIIAPDRPGIRDSSFQPDRTLLDWPPVIMEIANQLGIAEFRILAVSGGAPYAFATAWAMPGRVRAIAVVSGAPPITELEDRSGLLRIYNRMLALHAVQPQLLRALFHVARPFASIKPPIRFRPVLLKFLQPCDANAMRDSRSFEACFESARQAWRASAEGVMTDAEIYAKPWGFPLEEVCVPVRLWHGRKDRSFSFHVAEQVAARLPNCELHLVEDAGHYSLPIRHIREILSDLVRKVSSCAPR
jgi:pimeloyl-ACP methyl ester carboxylesterase